MTINKVIAGFLLLLACAAAQETKTARGHSVHGEIFNEGPRQAAVLIEGTGKLLFPVTTKSKAAQLFFEQGIGQLHGYWDFEAERTFRHVAQLDPDCAMAYWGMAMANFKNTKRATGFIEEATKRRDKAGEKEQLWIDSLAAYFKDPKADEKKRRLALVKALERLSEKYPDDVEPKAFLLRQIYQNKSKVPLASHYVVDLLGKQIFAQNPNHPSHHYIIHLWDGERPGNAVTSAELLGSTAPGIAHMWHMPGHTYSKLQRYREAAWQQEASARVDHAHMMKFRLLPDQISNFAHNNEWLIRNLNYLGRLEDAVDLARNMTELPRKPKFKKKDDDKSYNPSGSSWQYGRQRLRDTLFQFEKWDELLALEKTPYLAPDEQSLKKLDLQKCYAIAHYETGDAAGGNRIMKEVETLLTAEKKKRDDAIAAAEKKARDAGKKDKEIETAKQAAGKTFTKKVGDLESRFNEISVYAALAEKPANLKRALELLPKLRNLSKARHASLWQRAGNHEKAIALAGEAVNSAKNQVHPLTWQVEILHTAGKNEAAKEAFTTLRTVACDADPDLPALQRLAPIAAEFGFPEAWQIVSDLPKGARARPDLNSLGPFRWSPPSAPDFALRDLSGKEFQLSGQLGKATLLIFYLGKGCPHCMEQLNEFGPAMEKYKKAGINIVAISTDTPEGLAGTFASTVGGESEDNQNPFPFPLLSDAALKIFKQYRAFDDFENQPLHGTFLIDGHQKIRWQDISFEPFMYSDWLLEESNRLLAVKGN